MLDTKQLNVVKAEELKPLEGLQCFAHGGVNIFAGASGVGKSVYLEGLYKKLKRDGYNVVYINSDESVMGIPSYEGVSLNGLIGISKYADHNDVVFVDTLKAFGANSKVDINDDEHAYELMTELTKLARESGLTIILVHHTKADNTLEGSTSLFEGADTVAIFHRDKESGQCSASIKKQRFSFDCPQLITLEDYNESDKKC